MHLKERYLEQWAHLAPQDRPVCGRERVLGDGEGGHLAGQPELRGKHRARRALRAVGTQNQGHTAGLTRDSLGSGLWPF